MAQAEAEVHNVGTSSCAVRKSPGSVLELDSETQPGDGASPSMKYNPQMPHNILNADELERQYPSLQAVKDLDLPDLSRLEDDQLYSAGMAVVQNILHEMSQVGRTRHQGNGIPSGQTSVPEPDGARKGTRSG